MKRNNNKFELSYGHSEGMHWSCMPSKRVTVHNVEQFISLLDRGGVTDVVASTEPLETTPCEWSETIDKHGLKTEYRGVDLLYCVDGWRIRVGLRFRKESDQHINEIPVTAFLELERKGVRRNYRSDDTEAILRVMRYVKGVSERNALKHELFKKAVVRKDATIRRLEKENRELRKQLNKEREIRVS